MTRYEKIVLSGKFKTRIINSLCVQQFDETVECTPSEVNCEECWNTEIEEAE